MNKNISDNSLIFWEKGYLYISLLVSYYIWWLFSGNVGVLDWFKEIAYFDYIRTSIKDYNMLPYYWWNILPDIAWRPPLPGSSSFIAVPETTFYSPLTPLLLNFDTFIYAKLYVFFHFIPGVIGVFALRKKLKWNNEQFRIFIILFLFSPIVIQHMAVGYFTWYNFYYFPWMVYFMADKSTLKGIIGTAAILGLVILQGGIYIVQYLGLFWLIYELFHIIFEKDYKRIQRILFIPLLMISLSWARIASSITVYGDYVRHWFEIDAYNIPFFLFYAFLPTVTIPPIDLWFHTDFLGWTIAPHDSGQFWGLSLIMLMIVLIRYKYIVKDASSEKQSGLNYHAIFISASFLFVISFYRIWYDTMRILASLNVPLIETIKNHGIRFIMGSYFGYSLLLSTFISSIWKQLDVFVRTKLWSVLKVIIKYTGYCILLGSGATYFLLLLFKNVITNRFGEIITAAYNNTGHLWLRRRMEGMDLNDLEFYYYRFDHAFSSIHHWIFVIFTISITFYIIVLLIKKYKNRFSSLTLKFPHLKYELLLVIPLAFSTGMWMNLSTSVPFDEYPIRKVIPPDIIVLSDENLPAPMIQVKPDNLLLTPNSNVVPEGYLLTNIPYTDHKLFSIESSNAKFNEIDGKMMIIPLDNNPIKLQFKTVQFDRAIYITIVAWILIGIYPFWKTIPLIRRRTK